jgi:carbon monoxide dehydrogenase subunit G
MPGFRESATTAAAPEEVWKILYDPTRFPEWWTGIGSVEAEAAGPGETDPTPYTMYPDGYPDFPMPQILQTSREDRTVSVSCLVSDLRFEWRLEPAGAGTRISVEVEIPEAEAHRLAGQQEAIVSAVRRLAEVAAAA